MSQSKYLTQWRESVPTQIQVCANPLCSKEFRTRFGKYCCAVCKAKAHKLKERAKREERYCWWCSAKLTSPHKLKFCSREHQWKLDAARKAGRAVLVQVSPTLKIETKKWDKIPEIRKAWAEKLSRPAI
jgi:hypothetical protein